MDVDDVADAVDYILSAKPHVQVVNPTIHNDDVGPYKV